MILKYCEVLALSNGVPRVGGGDPALDRMSDNDFKCSPRRRG